MHSVNPKRKCGTCGKTGLKYDVVPYTNEVIVSGYTRKINVVDLPAIICPHCNSLSLTEASFERIDLEVKRLGS